MKIAFIGLGNMGLPMATRLARHGHDVYGRDARPASTAEFVATTDKAHELSHSHLSEMDVLVTMLPNSDTVETVLVEARLVDALTPGTLVIDMSSADPLRSRALGSALVSRGLKYVDAPVSGGVAGATAGTLTIMTGGSQDYVDEAADLFAIMGTTVIHVGATGAGHAAKALNNLVSAATVVATVEALHVAERFGIAGGTFVDVLNASSGRSNTSENKAKQHMLNGRYDSRFTIGLLSKDAEIGLALARQLDVPIAVGAEVASLWRSACDAGYADDDHTFMYELASTVYPGGAVEGGSGL